MLYRTFAKYKRVRFDGQTYRLPARQLAISSLHGCVMVQTYSGRCVMKYIATLSEK